MKNLYKMVGIVVLAMAIVFSFAACDPGTSSGGDSGGGNTSWPDSATLAKYGMEGFTLPAGLTVKKWEIIQEDNKDKLRITFTPYDLDKLKSPLTSIGWNYVGASANNEGFEKTGYLLKIYDY